MYDLTMDRPPATVVILHGNQANFQETRSRHFSKASNRTRSYHFRTEATNSGGTIYGADAEFTTEAMPPPVGQQVKALITHPALKRVRVIFEEQEMADYDQLSNPEEQRLESSLEIPIPTPCTIEVTTLADQVFEFKIPLKS